MNARVVFQTWRWQRVRWAVIGLAAFGWGMLIPVIYGAFSELFRELARSGGVAAQLMEFGSGSLFDLPGAITLGLQHPLAIAMLGVFAAGATSTAVAGERQRGTLEVLLARPISRTTLYLSIALALLVVIATVLALVLGGMTTGAVVQGVVDELDLGRMPLVFLNGLLLWSAFAAFGLAASVTFDRTGPAVGLTLAYLIVAYFLEVLGSLWRDVAWSQEYSLFHHFQPGEILTGRFDPVDLVILGIATVVPIVYALLIFPRRDLAAPA